MDSATQLEILQSVQGAQITINRGAVSIPMNALRGSTRGQMTGTDGTQVEFNTVDWLVSTWQTQSLGKPQRGDTITYGAKTYTVSHPDNNTRCVVWHGNDETAYRIHSAANGQ